MERGWSGNARRLSQADKALIERLIRGGETYGAIAAAVECSEKSVQRYMAMTGGVKSRTKGRSPRYLSLEDREEISRDLLDGESLRAIARRLGRMPSTISREVALNGGRDEYRASSADNAALERGRRPKPTKLSGHPQLRGEVTRGLEACWSPKQISATLVQQFPDDASMRISPETIYKTLFVQARGELRRELTAHLRTGRSRRRPQMRAGRSGQGKLQDMVMISERPAEAADRAIPGHWEGDLIIGKGGQSAIGTLVERSSRFVMLFRLPHGRSAENFRVALTRTIGKLPVELRRTLTWDQGKEMADHIRFSTGTQMKVYFCDPHSPWQRGSNENTNGLLRQYFPSTTDLSVHNTAHLNKVARQLNGRPRETLGWRKPAEVYGSYVAPTV